MSIKLVTGFYGVGKSEFSVNLLLKNSNNKHKKSILIDMDIINPYFRSREAKEYLNNKGILVIDSGIKNETLDLPAISPEIRTIFRNSDNYSDIVIDLGGDVVGLNSIISLEDSYDKEKIEVYYVININRIEKDSYNKIYRHMLETEKKLGIKVKYIVNNTHMLNYTSFEDVLLGNNIAIEIAKEMKIDFEYIINSYSSNITNIDRNFLEGNLFPMAISLRKEWMK